MHGTIAQDDEQMAVAAGAPMAGHGYSEWSRTTTGPILAAGDVFHGGRRAPGVPRAESRPSG